jgi:hypothetical protein
MVNSSSNGQLISLSGLRAILTNHNLILIGLTPPEEELVKLWSILPKTEGKSRSLWYQLYSYSRDTFSPRTLRMSGKAEFPKLKLELKKHQVVLPSNSSPLTPGIPHGDDDHNIPLIDAIVIQGNICDLDLEMIGKPPPKTLRSSPSRASFFTSLNTPAVSNARHLKLPEIHTLTSDPGYILFMHKVGGVNGQPFVVDITKFLASYSENKNIEAQAVALNSFFDRSSKGLQDTFVDQTELVVYGFHSYVLSALYKQYDPLF